MTTPRGPVGSITVICGSMFSGKTEELIRLVRRAMHARKRVQVFKSSVDTRCDTTLIRTHDGMSFTALAVPNARTLEKLLAPNVQVVGIEEIQFFDEAIVDLCQRLADQGIQVIAAGLDQDFRGLPFTFMPTLLASADNVLKLHAICKVCGEEASRTQRLVDGRPAGWDEPTILVGADESYEARCRRCHKVRNAPKKLRAQTGRAAGFTAFPAAVSETAAEPPTDDFCRPSSTPRATSSRPLPSAKQANKPRLSKNGNQSHLPSHLYGCDASSVGSMQLEMFPEGYSEDPPSE